MPLQGYSKGLEEIGRLAPAEGDILQKNGGTWAARSPTALPVSDAAEAEMRRLEGTRAVDVPFYADGKLVLETDTVGATHFIDPVTGHRSMRNLVLDGGRGPAQNGILPVAFDRTGNVISGYSDGDYIQFHPERFAGVVVQGDHNKISQLWWIEDNPNRGAQIKRQLTYSQHGVTGYRWVKYPDMAAGEPGIVIAEFNDHDLIRDRFKSRRVHVHPSAPTEVPTKIVMVVVNSQSNGVGAGPTNAAFPGIGNNAQTTRKSMPLRRLVHSGTGAQLYNKLLMFNGGVIPHQGGATGPIAALDAAQIASLQPLVEGTNAVASNRETFLGALAHHLNGPNGYDGSAYIIAATLGVGGTGWKDLFYDVDDVGAERQQAYLNCLIAIERAQVLATNVGLPLEVHFVVDQGENDMAAGISTYQDLIEEWLPIMQADVEAITSQAVTPQLFLAQTMWARGTENRPADSSLAQVNAAIANADVHILPPAYFADYNGDTAHYPGCEHQWRGALYGEVMADWLIRGENSALYATAATYSGATMQATFTHPLQRDNDTIVPPTAGGISHDNSAGTTVSLSAVRLNQADPTKLDLAFGASVPGGAAETFRVGHGAQVSTSALGFDVGLRSVWRRSDWERYSMLDGRPLYIFANLQEIVATAA
ncbi:hypothetical protein [Mesorhizobium sp. J428]|uniref:hypothetical protein n=1 Tax=Mesorhizobium sp. J428 TaxID=2898440 RepID=UPI0021514234|nr:hypothetical protein [Mesorhizobium sp. J428]MCR5859732.1 hypothetical protein [Mesorhizobium sp. J428]